MTGREGDVSAAPARGRGKALRRLILPGACALLATTILAGLGTWQVQRLHWKEDLIARVEARVDGEPVPAPPPAAWDEFSIERWQFTPVEATGRFVPGELHVYIALTRPQGPLGGPGYFLISPFRTEAGWFVLVNRGFVPDAAKEAGARPGSAPPAGEVDLVGLVRESETPNFVTPEPNRDDNVWFARERAAMAAALNLPPARVAPYFIDAAASTTPPGGLPQAGETRLAFPNNHLQYAITWYGLALTCMAVFGAFAWRRLRGEPG